MIENLDAIYEISEFRELLKNSTPIIVKDIDIVKINAYLPCGDYTFFIRDTHNEVFTIALDSSLSYIEQIFEFLESIYYTKGEIAVIIDGDGPETTLYAKYIDKKNIRFFIADTCNAYEKFVKNEVNDYSYELADIRYDVIIDKHVLIKRFYDELSPIFINYDKVEIQPWGNEIENLDEWLEKLRNIILY